MKKVKKVSKVKKVTRNVNSEKFENETIVEMYCKKCGRKTPASAKAESVTCYKCTALMAPLEIKVEKEKSSFPPGWKIMPEFVDSDGTVYHKGIEQPKLKGKRPITDVEAIREKMKKKREETKRKKRTSDIEDKKQEKLVKEYKKKKEAIKKDKEAKAKKLKKLGK